MVSPASNLRISYGIVPEGGPGIFLRRLRRELERRDRYAGSGGEVLLTTGQIRDARSADRNDQTLAFRVDGCYYERATLSAIRSALRRKLGKPPVDGSPFENLSTPLTGLFNWYRNRHIRACLDAAAVVIYQSAFSRRLVRRFVRDVPGPIIHNGVDGDAFHPEGQEEALPGDPCLITSGRFRPHKRLQEAVRVLDDLRLRHPDARLHVLGGDDGRTLGYCRQLVRDLSLEDAVVFHGRRPPEMLPRYYRAADLMIAPSILDPCPNVLVEALACGLPVVASSIGGSAELVGEQGGVVIQENFDLRPFPVNDLQAVPSVDVPRWTKAVEAILCDLEARGRAARQRFVENFEIEAIADAYLDAIADGAGSRNRSR